MSIETQANAIREMLMAEMEKSKKIIFDGLLNSEPLNSIPESLFVNYFLPCFLGQNKNPNWVMEWVSIAGTPMSEVGVVDDVTGELLYTVPSLLNSNNLILHKEPGDLGDIFTKYDQISANTPVRGLGFLLEALNCKNQELISKINFDEVNQKWYNILRRYNLIPEIKEQEKESSVTEEDIFEF